VHQSLYLWSKAALPSYILAVLGDRMETAHSVEGRVPFLDYHVVELVRDLPIAQEVRGLTEKYVLREAARPVRRGSRRRGAGGHVGARLLGGPPHRRFWWYRFPV
jgi:asparagine synthetase B (glutamine-hydrolysing)